MFIPPLLRPELVVWFEFQTPFSSLVLDIRRHELRVHTTSISVRFAVGVDARAEEWFSHETDGVPYILEAYDTRALFHCFLFMLTVLMHRGDHHGGFHFDCSHQSKNTATSAIPELVMF